MPQIETFVFFDIETTGLPWEERNRTKIIEASFIAASRRDILRTEFGSIPCVSKLTIMFNPQRPIDPAAVKITGLNDRLLKYAPTFKEKFQSIYSFLNNLPKPVCLLAHNGNVFDYKVLLAECADAKQSLPNDILCADTLVAFRSLLKGTTISHSTLKPKSRSDLEQCNLTDDEDEDEGQIDAFENKLSNQELWPELDVSTESWNEIDDLCQSLSDTSFDSMDHVGSKIRQNKVNIKKTQKGKTVKTREDIVRNVFETKTVSHNCFKLGNVYSRLLGRDPVNAHRAEADCLMMLECAVAFKDIIPWCEDNCKSLFEIKPLKRY